MTKQRAAFELILAGALWGFGFVAVVWALEVYSPTQVLFLRFIIAFVAGELLRRIIWNSGRFFPNWKQAKISTISGLFLGLMLLFQTIGLQTTTASKSGFLTSLYVVFVPLLNTVFFKKHLSWQALACLIVSLTGLILILGSPQQGWVVGDFWTLLCALFAAIHIMYIGFQAKTASAMSPLLFNNYQNLAALVLMSLLLKPEDLNFPSLSLLPTIGLFIVGLGGSLLAFTIQVRAQKFLSDTTASMIFLLESPFAFFFAWIFLGENFSSSQSLGALFILIGSLSIQWVTRRSDA